MLIETKLESLRTGNKVDTTISNFYLCGDTLVTEPKFVMDILHQQIQIKNKLCLFNSETGGYFGFDAVEFPHSSILDSRMARSENSEYDYIIRTSEYKKYTTYLSIDSSIHISSDYSKFGKNFSNIFTDFGAIKELLRLPDSLHVSYRYILNDETCKDKIIGELDIESIKMIEIPGMNPSTKTENNPKSKIPDISLLNKDGIKVSLKDFIKNSPEELVFLDFWASWCKPCIEEFKYLTDLYNQMPTNRIRFIGINIDKEIDFGKAQKIIETNYLSWDQLYDFEFTNKKWEEISLNGIPRFMILDKKGSIIIFDAPRPSSDQLKAVLTNLLK